MACPHVSGLAARMYEAYPSAGSMTAAQRWALLKATNCTGCVTNDATPIPTDNLVILALPANPCSVFDGSGASATYPCDCGSALCTNGEICTSSIDSCGSASPTPAPAPTAAPTIAPPTDAPTHSPTAAPTAAPTAPTDAPTASPTVAPTAAPTVAPTAAPTASPKEAPTDFPTAAPTAAPTGAPTAPPPAPTVAPTPAPTASPTAAPTDSPTATPTAAPTVAPTPAPTASPTAPPTASPTAVPTSAPTEAPTAPPPAPTVAPTVAPTISPTAAPTASPTGAPTAAPTAAPTFAPTPAPAPPPTAAPTPQHMWATVSGPCTVDGTCVQSPNHPSNYGGNQMCTIGIDEANAAPIVVEAFNTESNRDYLIVNGAYYSGTSGPSGVTPSASIVWSSDRRKSSSGWRLCMPVSTSPPPPTAKPTPAPTGSSTPAPPVAPTPAPAPPPTAAPTPASQHMWATVSGPCTLDGTCVQSPNHPSNYGGNQMCTIGIDEANAAPIVVEAFNTESNRDYLIVNGAYYSGTSGPSGVTPSFSIVWSSDRRKSSSGWRLCMPDRRLEAAEPNKAAFALTAPTILV
ncbi:unnamed protein product [Prorocentrum cordatum]|uniref:subtilisin n=1 Tax=Prorocentrum cordatum TaxID=2364126 RepID=A0ABN9PIW8_9DINO|nr:unnamed protein product [Polarella glacialis]